MPIRDLAAHTARFVTVAELADYWSVSRQQIYKRIESGALDAICLGSRLYRIRTAAALEYERRASVNPATPKVFDQPDMETSVPQGRTLPRKIGLQRVR